MLAKQNNNSSKDQRPSTISGNISRDISDRGQRISGDWFKAAIKKDIPHIREGNKDVSPTNRHIEQKGTDVDKEE